MPPPPRNARNKIPPSPSWPPASCSHYHPPGPSLMPAPARWRFRNGPQVQMRGVPVLPRPSLSLRAVGATWHLPGETHFVVSVRATDRLSSQGPAPRGSGAPPKPSTEGLPSTPLSAPTPGAGCRLGPSNPPPGPPDASRRNRRRPVGPVWSTHVSDLAISLCLNTFKPTL